MDSFRSTNTPWFAVSAALMGLIVGYGIASAQLGLLQGPRSVPTPSPVAGEPEEPLPPPPPPPEVTDEDHVFGNKNAEFTVIEYSDFECPFCKRHYTTMKQIVEDYDGKVNHVFRHFPLGFHQNAMKEAEASECVAELAGNTAFWKFHDEIFEKTTSNGTGFALADLAPLAKSLGVNEQKFKECLDGGKYTQFVQDQMEKGSTAGVKGTPGSFVINNKTDESVPVSGAVPLANFKKVIDAMLVK